MAVQPVNSYTPQGTQLNTGITSALNPIPNPAPQNPLNTYQNAEARLAAAQKNYPTFIQDQTKQLTNQAQIPQMSNAYSLDYNTFLTMLQKDPYGQQTYLSGQKNASDASGGTPGSGNPVVAAAPQLTLNSLAQGFQGFTNPYNASQAENTNAGGIESVLNRLGVAITGNLADVQQEVGQRGQQYQADLSSVQTLLNTYLSLYQATNPTSTGGGSGSSASGLTATTQAEATTRIKAGASLGQLANEFPDADPRWLYDTYNSSSPNGRDKGTFSQFGQAFGKVQSGINLSATGKASTDATKKATTSTALAKLDAVKAAYQRFLQTRSPNDLQNYNAQVIAFSDAYAYSLNKSRADASVKRIVGTLPNFDNPVNSAWAYFAGDGGFQGAETQMLADAGVGSRAELGGSSPTAPNPVPTPAPSGGGIWH